MRFHCLLYTILCLALTARTLPIPDLESRLEHNALHDRSLVYDRSLAGYAPEGLTLKKAKVDAKAGGQVDKKESKKAAKIAGTDPIIQSDYPHEFRNKENVVKGHKGWGQGDKILMEFPTFPGKDHQWDKTIKKNKDQKVPAVTKTNPKTGFPFSNAGKYRVVTNKDDGAYRGLLKHTKDGQFETIKPYPQKPNKGSERPVPKPAALQPASTKARTKAKEQVAPKKAALKQAAPQETTPKKPAPFIPEPVEVTSENPARKKVPPSKALPFPQGKAGDQGKKKGTVKKP